MAVELTDLYKSITSDYEVKLLTINCFEKKVDWVHVMEDDDFVNILHGEELIFNSSLNYETDEVRKRFITNLITAQASGLIIAISDIRSISLELIDYCNQKHFPLFWASWNTSYLNIMRKVSKILIANERNETNLISALKNAIYYPENDKLYSSHFDRNGFSPDSLCTIVLVEIDTANESFRTQKLLQLQKSLHYNFKKNVSYEESGVLTIFICDSTLSEIKEVFYNMQKKSPALRVSIGSCEKSIQNISLSYERALTTSHLQTHLPEAPFISYDELGIYQILTDVKHSSVYPAFVTDVLGKLIDYDTQNHTNFLEILDCFFKNDCHLANTAEALFFHKNTLKYKMNKIREILGCDILSNQNRIKIMTALAINSLGNEFYTAK